MLKRSTIPTLTEVAGTPMQEAEKDALVDPARAERLAQLLEEQLQPIIKEAIRDAVKDSARRLARDLRRRLDAELSLMVREAVDDAVHAELKDPATDSAAPNQPTAID